MLSIIIGSVIIAVAVTIAIVSIIKTPKNLRGFYSKFYWRIASIAIVAGLTIIASELLPILMEVLQ